MINPRQLEAGTLVVASHNEGKVRELRAMLSPWMLTIISAAELDLPEPEENGTTYQENAIIKSRAAAMASGYPALSDDSGFEVSAINNAPGLYSARWAGPSKDFSIAMDKVWTAFGASGQSDRSCRFVCALSLAWPDGHDETVIGDIAGSLVWPPRGDKGFGYDPIFSPDGYDETFAEVDPEWKHSVSHRARAFSALIDRCLADTPRVN